MDAACMDTVYATVHPGGSSGARHDACPAKGLVYQACESDDRRRRAASKAKQKVRVRLQHVEPSSPPLRPTTHGVHVFMLVCGVCMFVCMCLSLCALYASILQCRAAVSLFLCAAHKYLYIYI